MELAAALTQSLEASELASAIAQGLDYLHQHQYPNGEFCSYFAPDAAMQEWCVHDSCIFPTALVANSLLSLAQHPQAEEMLTRTTGFLQYHMNRGGLWHHFTGLHPMRDPLPLDMDDTACVSALLQARGVDCPTPTNVPLLLANRNRQGLFYTWFVARGWNANRTHWRITLPRLARPLRNLLLWRSVEATPGDVDPVVNANALYYLGDIPETQPVIAWLLRLIAEHQEAGCDKWYPDPHVVYYFLSRNYSRGITQLEPARQPVIDRIVAAARPDGRLGNTVLDTALAICTLLNWGAQPPELRPAVQFLLGAQQAHGEWPRWLVYYGGAKKLVGWGSEEMTTAFCLEALARYQAIIS
ncbi:prenyltransferase/squalene oxidase repeat-containing protein [Hymenobacter negativus]|uniref:Prenyltransferase n=1 Tax=Hymenobacter negativus TaxID=2795026 RepID=A0ABS0QBL7_9BACT|nr:hypothetical protein [Hymenobacter negativus]MBH8560010.1 hypothetical protein [Hymenobacter negativus]